MKKKMKNRNIILFFYSFFIIISIQYIVGCKSTSKEIIVYDGCKEIEIVSDIENSLPALKEYCKENNITLSINNNTSKCGYQLKYGSNVLNLESAMTDVDLIDQCNMFFKK